MSLLSVVIRLSNSLLERAEPTEKKVSLIEAAYQKGQEFKHEVARLLAEDPCSINNHTNIFISSELSADKTKLVKDIHAFLANAAKRDPRSVCALPKVHVLGKNEFDLHIETDDAARSDVFALAQAQADYHSQTREITFKEGRVNQHVFNHELAHHQHLTGMLGATAERISSLSWDEVLGSCTEDGRYDSEFIAKDYYDSSYVTEYAKKSYREDVAETIESAKQDPISECNQVGSALSGTRLFQSNARMAKIQAVCDDQRLIPHLDVELNLTEYRRISQYQLHQIKKREDNREIFIKEDKVDVFIKIRDQEERLGRLNLAKDMKVLLVEHIPNSGDILVTASRDSEHYFIRMGQKPGSLYFDILDLDKIASPFWNQLQISHAMPWEGGLLYAFYRKENKYGKHEFVYFDPIQNQVKVIRTYSYLLDKHLSSIERFYEENGKIYVLGYNKKNKPAVVNLDLQIL